jgi:hypothetical protein
VRACINPAHHEAVTLTENNRRRRERAIERGKTHRDIRQQDRHLRSIRALAEEAS